MLSSATSNDQTLQTTKHLMN